MTIRVPIRIAQTTTVVGSGAITFSGSISGFRNFSTLTDGWKTVVTVDNATSGGQATQFETLLVTYFAAGGGSLVVDAVYASTNGNSKISWGAGTKNVYVVDYPPINFRKDEDGYYNVDTRINFDAKGGGPQYSLRVATGGDFLIWDETNDLSIASYDWDNGGNPTKFRFGVGLTSSVEVDAPIIKRNGAEIGTASLLNSGASAGQVPVLDGSAQLARSTLPIVSGATSGTAGAVGAMKAPAAGEHTAYARGDGNYGRPSRVKQEAWRTSWAVGTEYTWAHGLSAYPVRAWAEIECVTAQHNIVSGERFEPPAPNVTSSRGVFVAYNSTSVRYVVSSAGIQVTNTAGSVQTITPANFKIRVCAVLNSDVG